MSDQLLPIPWLDVLLIFGLIVLNGVLAMSELAIVSAREARLKAMPRTVSACALSSDGETALVADRTGRLFVLRARNLRP